MYVFEIVNDILKCKKQMLCINHTLSLCVKHTPLSLSSHYTHLSQTITLPHAPISSHTLLTPIHHIPLYYIFTVVDESVGCGGRSFQEISQTAESPHQHRYSEVSHRTAHCGDRYSAL